MSLYTLVFIFVTILILSGLALFGLFISKLDKWIDRRERLGKESIYKKKSENSNSDNSINSNSV
jgi:uncharacterized membrane protein YqhA